MRLKSGSDKRLFISRLNHFSKHWLTLGISIFLSCSLSAQVFIKQNPAGSGDGSSWSNAAGASNFESAIDQGGTIYVAAGTYTFSQTVILSQEVSITGGYPANASGTDLSGYDPATNLTILDGDGGNVSNKSAFQVTSDPATSIVTIRGIQFQNWRGTSGSVFGAWSRVINPVYYTFDECSFINNVGNAGVIHLSNLGHPQNQIYITNCNFVNNVGYNSSNLAGAIYLNAVYRQNNLFQPVTGNLVIYGNSFHGNTAQTGGAIWTNQAFGWNISNNCFSNNLASSAGGACRFSNMSSTIFNGNQFFSNFVSGGNGGAMQAQTVNFIEFNDNIFTNNTAWTYGGALELVGVSLQGANNEYSDNTSGLASPVYNGGAIFHVQPYMSTVASNLTTSIFHNNTPDHVQLNTNSMFNLGPGNQFDPVGFTPTPAVACPSPFISSPDTANCSINPSMIVSADTICPHDIISVSSTDLGPGATYIWSFGSTASPSTASGIGPHQVSYNACGIDTIFLFVNTDSCALSDTMIINIIDNTAPVFTVPPDQTVYFDAACAIDYSPLVTGEVTDETDNCASNLDANYTDDPSGLTACNGTGVIIRTWSLIDSCSNISTQTQQITLRDTIAPAWTTSPADITIECDGTADPGGAISAWLAANGGGTAADACGAVTFTHDYTGLTSSTCTGAGSATVTFTATDNCGNFSTRSGILTISDTTAPTLTPVADITADCNNIPVPVAPIASDLCDPDVSLVYQEVIVYHPNQNWKSTSSCSLLYTVSDTFFDDKGTADPADDEVSFTLTVIGQNTGSSWNANINGITITGNYYQINQFGPILSNGSPLNFTIIDAADPGCTVDVSIN